MEQYSPCRPSVKTLWHKKMQAALDYIAKEVLNNESVLCQAYRKMNVPSLLASIGNSNHNILVVGKRFSWMINARTEGHRFFVGTRINYGYNAQLTDHHNWTRLEEQVKRYAAPGARITVYTLPFL